MDNSFTLKRIKGGFSINIDLGKGKASIVQKKSETFDI